MTELSTSQPHDPKAHRRSNCANHNRHRRSNRANPSFLPTDIANWDLRWQNETTLTGNTVNADEMIGVVLMNDDFVGAGWHCSGNSPPAVFKGKSSTPCPA